jgi:hypothetical protein
MVSRASLLDGTTCDSRSPKKSPAKKPAPVRFAARGRPQGGKAHIARGVRRPADATFCNGLRVMRVLSQGRVQEAADLRNADVASAHGWATSASIPPIATLRSRCVPNRPQSQLAFRLSILRRSAAPPPDGAKTQISRNASIRCEYYVPRTTRSTLTRACLAFRGHITRGATKLRQHGVVSEEDSAASALPPRSDSFAPGRRRSTESTLHLR